MDPQHGRYNASAGWSYHSVTSCRSRRRVYGCQGLFDLVGGARALRSGRLPRDGSGPQALCRTPGVGAKMGNGLLATLLGVLILANQGAAWSTQMIFGLALTALYTLKFIDFL